MSYSATIFIPVLRLKKESIERHLILPKACDLRPVTDDMALCHPSLRQPKNQDKLALMDAENAWFVRLNHITHIFVQVLTAAIEIDSSSKPLKISE